MATKSTDISITSEPKDKTNAFLNVDRVVQSRRPVTERVNDSCEFNLPLGEKATQEQASRCMDCAIPYCHSKCPLNNKIPDFNDLVYNGDWKTAARNLHSTNNFPEITGRVCPAPCEAACTLNIEDKPVTIKTIECEIAAKALDEGWVKPQPAKTKTEKKIAIVGSGPAGMAAAQQLVRVGHEVHVFEKNSRPGGLMVYGIPDFKLDKKFVDWRVKQLKDEGVIFHCNVHIGVDKPIAEIEQSHDAMILAGGAEIPRDLPVDGHKLDGIHFAMDFLTQQNRHIAGEPLDKTYTNDIAKGLEVVVIGGGDTGSDCIGTSIRQGAQKVTQIEIMPQPPEHENKELTWPHWPMKMRTSSSQEEGAEREFAVMTKSFEDDGNGRVANLICCKVRFENGQLQEVEGSEFKIKADLVLLAMGFTKPVYQGMLKDLGVKLDRNGCVCANEKNYETSKRNIFVAGDMRRGQSLVVWAIREGRQVARAVDEALMGETSLRQLPPM